MESFFRGIYEKFQKPPKERHFDEIEPEKNTRGESQPDEYSSVEYINPLKSEHLNAGIKPIIACVEQGTRDFFERDILQKMPMAQNVDYYGDSNTLSEQNFKNAGDGTYVISCIDSAPKFSKSYKNCTGVIVSGIDKETGKNISLMSHQDPWFFAKEGESGADKFAEDMQERLSEMKERCVPGTIDAVIAGGNHFTDKYGKEEDESFRKDYGESIKILTREIKKAFGFEPAVIVGPKTVTGGSDFMFYDNDNRRIHIVRPQTGDSSSESYVPQDYARQEKKWTGGDYNVKGRFDK